MNAKQSLKFAAKRIEDMEHQIMLNIRDIRLYVQCILSMINHGSPCEYCEDRDECEINGRDISIGCDEWMLKLWSPGEEVRDWQRAILAGKKQNELFGEAPEADGYTEDDGADHTEGTCVPGGDDPVFDRSAVE